MRADPSCPRCAGRLHSPGLWSSDWLCDQHGAVAPLQPAVQPTAETLRQLVATRAGPGLVPWPLPKGWLVTGLAHAGDERTGARATRGRLLGPGAPGRGRRARPGRRGARHRSGRALRRARGPGPRRRARHPAAAREDPRRRPPDRDVGARRSADDRAVYVGEALGCWLWAVLWPESAGFLLIDDFVLHGPARRRSRASTSRSARCPHAWPADPAGVRVAPLRCSPCRSTCTPTAPPPTAPRPRPSWCAAAAAAGLDVVALTDHDTTRGLGGGRGGAAGRPAARARRRDLLRLGRHQPAPAGLPLRPGPRGAGRRDVDGPRRPGAAGQGDRRQAGRRRPPDHLGPGAGPAAATAPRSDARTSPTRWSRSAWCPTATRPSTTLLHDDGPFFVGHYYVDAVRAVRLVREAGGVPVFAHPAAAKRGHDRRRRRDRRDGRGRSGRARGRPPGQPARGPRPAARDSPRTWTCWSPAPATTTAPARTTGSARTRPTPRSCEALVAQATGADRGRRRETAGPTSSSSSRSSSRCS